MDSLEFQERISTSIENLNSLLVATRSFQENTLYARLSEILQWDTTGTLKQKEMDVLRYLTLDTYQKIREFFEDYNESGENFSQVFYNRYGVHHHQILDIDCDVKDNQIFWSSFKQNLNEDDMPETVVMAYAILVTLAEINKPQRCDLFEEITTMKICENKRLLDMLVKFYAEDIGYQFAQNQGGKAVTFPFKSMSDENARFQMVGEYFPIGRNLLNLQTKNTPDVFMQIGHFFNDAAQSESLNSSINLLSLVDPNVHALKAAKIIDLSDHRQRKLRP